MAAATAVAQVQVLALADRTVAASTGAVGRSSENFCVVSTTGGAVSLSFTNAGGLAADGQGWNAKNAAGAAISYLQVMANSDGSGEVTVSRTGGGNAFTVPASRTVATSTACGSGNVTKSVMPTSARSPIGSGPYSDVVTVTAAPV